MTEKHPHDHKPWQPTMDREPELNPFVSHQDPTGALENPPPLADDEAEDAAEEKIK